MLAQLVEYYRRRAEDAPETTPLRGYSVEKIAFEIWLSPDGDLVAAPDLRVTEKKKLLPRLLAVPRSGGPRTSGVRAFFLSDKSSYLLGADPKLKPAQVAEHFAASRALHHRLLDGVDDAGGRALLAFLDRWDPARAPELIPGWDDLAGLNLVIRLVDDHRYLHQRPALRAVWEAEVARQEGESLVGQCLVTGETGPIARTHPMIKGVRGAQTSGAAIVSFTQDCFVSYGHDQGANAPVGGFAAFAYTTALNELLRPGSDQKLSLGDATVVFWADRQCEAEGVLGQMFNPPLDSAQDTGAEGDRALDPEATDRLRRILHRLRDGQPVADTLADFDPEVRFFILGLAAPSESRLAVRFWRETTLGALLDHVGAHWRALRIEKRHPAEPDFPPPWLLMRQVALAGKDENIPPALGPAFLRAMLTGAPYPDALLAAVLERMRAGHGESEPVSYLRVALIKAWLVRHRPEQKDLEDSLMTLNPDRPEASYHLGRLFAALERAQQLALPGINATIKDRYFGTASAAPRSVFPNLIRLAQHHLSKVETSGWLDRIIGEITGRIDDFPSHMPLADQGLFALGYYHQRNDLWRSKKTDDAPHTES